LLRIFNTAAGPNGRVEEYVRVHPPVTTVTSPTVESEFSSVQALSGVSRWTPQP